MKYIYKPKSKYEKFALSVYKILVENFSSSFFVGGMVRDILWNKKITDIDIVSSATPNEIVNLLKNTKYMLDLSFQNFGVVLVKHNKYHLTISTFRKESYGNSRYPKIEYIQNPKEDAKRRDFTINSLYLSVKENKIYDFHKGLLDIKAKQLKFIGNAKTKIQEDPLRILRALRFATKYKLKIEPKTFLNLKKYFELTKKVSVNKINSEIKKLKRKSDQEKLISILNNKNFLDFYFK